MMASQSYSFREEQLRMCVVPVRENIQKDIKFFMFNLAFSGKRQKFSLTDLQNELKHYNVDYKEAEVQETLDTWGNRGLIYKSNGTYYVNSLFNWLIRILVFISIFFSRTIVLRWVSLIKPREWYFCGIWRNLCVFVSCLFMFIYVCISICYKIQNFF